MVFPSDFVVKIQHQQRETPRGVTSNIIEDCCSKIKKKRSALSDLDFLITQIAFSEYK